MQLINSIELFDDFYLVDKERLLNKRSIQQRLSGADINYDKINSLEDFIEKAVKHITKLGSGLFSFISGEKISPSIHYDIKTQKSFCSLEKNHVGIGLKVLLDKELPKQLLVDSLIAVQLHEFLHKRITITDIAKKYSINRTEYYDLVKNEVGKLFSQHKLFPIILNIYEDRRIELRGMERFPGYVFYFEQLRKYALHLHSNSNYWYYNNVGNKQFYLPLEYLKIKILLPEFEEKLLDLLNETQSDFTPVSPLTIPLYDSLAYYNFISSYSNKFSKEVVDTIYKIKEFTENNKELIINGDFEDMIYLTNETIKLIPESLQKSIIDMGLDEETVSIFSNEFEGDALDSDLEGIDFDKILQESMEQCDEGKEGDEKEGECEIEEVKFVKNIGSVTTFYEKVVIQKPSSKEFDENLYYKAKQDAKQIKVYLNFLSSKFNRNIELFQLDEGDIDEAQLYSIKYKKDIFFTEEVIEDYELDFGILLDESGSMRRNIQIAKQAVLTLALGLEKNKNINLFVYGHTANSGTPLGTFEMFRYYNSFENFKNINTFFTASFRSGNADGYAILKMGEIMLKSKNKRKVLIVASDGYPNAMGYSGDKAIEHTRDSVNLLESKGIVVIQLCIDNIANSDKMFKNVIPYQENKNFSLQLKTILLKQLTKLSNSL